MTPTDRSGSFQKLEKSYLIKLFSCVLPILLLACASKSSLPSALSAPRGELRTDISEIDDAAALRMARRFENAGDLGSALNMYRRAVQMAPENTAALLGVARIYGQAGAQEEAARYHRRILQLEPANSGAAAAIAEAHIFKGEARQAITFINQFLLAAPGTPGLYNTLGIAHDLEGAHGDAQLAYAEGLNMAPDDSAITSNLALSFAVIGDYQTSIALLERVLGDAAKSDEAERSIARQNLALVYALSGQLEAAEDIARTVLSEQEVQINRTFYARLPGLDSREKAQAVFLGSLPSLVEAPGEEETAPEITETSGARADGLPFLTPPLTEAEKDAAAARIVRGQGSAELPAPREKAGPEPEAGAETVTEPVAPATAATAVKEAAAEAGAVTLDEYPPYWVQLSSYRSPERARTGWDTLSAQFPDLLGGYVGYLKTYQSEEKGEFFRLMVQASETRSAANLVCTTFRAGGLDCLAIRTGGNIRLLLEVD